MGSEGNIYRSIGVEPIINCRGTFTIIGGSVERPEVLEAMEAASGYFVQYDELAEGVGRRLAELTGAEWGLVAAGCAAGIKHITAACVTGGNPEKLIRIPDLTGLDKTQVIAPRYSRNAYDHAVRNIGVEMITVETPEELEGAINPKTAMIYLVTGPASDPGQPLSLEVIARIAEPQGIPVLADAAAENFVIPNIHLQQGANAVAYSGGKALCGPQCAGLVLGDKALLKAAWQASSPHHGPGRDNKIGKEEIMGMLAAVEAWTRRDHEAEWQAWLDILAFIAARAEQVEGVTTAVNERTGLSNRAPVLAIVWDPEVLHITGEEVAEDFARNAPRIAVGSGDGDGKAAINITPSQMQPGDAEVVAERIHATLAAERTPRATGLAAPGADLSGYWDLDIRFFNGASRHQLYIEQRGNWIGGVHVSDFSTQALEGVVEGDNIKLKSTMSRPGNAIPFMFSGKVSDGVLAGAIHLGEYLKAEFTAARAEHPPQRRPIAIPSGPPLAT